MTFFLPSKPVHQLKMLVALIMITSILNATEPQWRTGQLRYSQKFVDRDTRPVATGHQRTTTLLLDRMLRPRQTNIWLHALEADGQVFILQTKKALNLDIGSPVRFRRANDRIILIDRDGREQKCGLAAQMTREEAARWGK